MRDSDAHAGRAIDGGKGRGRRDCVCVEMRLNLEKDVIHIVFSVKQNS